MISSFLMKLKDKAAVLVLALVMVLGLAGMPVETMAAAGDVPAHAKMLQNNGDGTYKLALNVTGEAEKIPQKANVTVVFDTSSSMNTSTGNSEVTYTPINYDSYYSYGLIDGEYVRLELRNSGSYWNPNYTYWYNNQQYTGQRYSRQEANQSRLDAAKDAVNALAEALLANNGGDNPDDTIEIALVDFANMANIVQAPTTDLADFQSVVNSRDAGNNDRGTNWEAGLRTALNVNYNDDDTTYIIFVSDGNPTFYVQNNGERGGSGQENNDNITRSYNEALPAAQAIVAAENEFYTIGIYGNVDRMEGLTTGAGAPADHYYPADNTAAMQEAFAEILAKIEMSGIGEVDIKDGTTNKVAASSGVVELLEVDESSYKYYRAGGTNEDGSVKYDPTANTITPIGEETVNIGVEWTAGEDPAPPAAQLVNGAVDWDLSSLDVLENGVTYTVTFDVYPSQTTYDIIAQLKNGDITYDSLDTEVKQYIADNGGGNYTLRTNTSATLSWDDTRDDAEQQTDNYVNPDPVGTNAQQLTVNKKWEGADADVESLPITVLMDGEEFHTASLSAENNWETSSYISVGIIKNGQALSGALGHDFSFAELDDTQYRWELDAPTVRPMLVNGTLTMLIKVDKDHPAPSGATTYTIDGSIYYVDSAAGGLTATNHRRSNLNLTKTVTGEDAPEDATFPFTLTVNNAKAPATAPEGDTEHNSDYWVWFSIFDTKAGATVTDATVSRATGPNADGYYYAPSGSAISVQMKDGWNLRFINLPSGTTYTFVEGDLAEGFAFKSAELKQGEDSTFSGGQTTTGTIGSTKTSFYVEYTNDYQLTDLEITKVWDDANNQDGKRLTADELKAKLTLAPEVQGNEPTIVDNGDDTYTITYKGLPRFNNGQEVEYTVTESPIDGYETTGGSPAKDHGTITNKHTPEVTTVTVVKVWDDSDDIGGIRPASIQAQLTADGSASGEAVTLNADNTWTYTWENLPKYNAGKEIAYSADETAVPAGYTKGDKDPVKEVADDGTIKFTVTNTYNPTPVSVDPPVKKVITGKEDLYNGGDFTFTIAATSPANAPMPANTSITNSAKYELQNRKGFYEFGEIKFTMPGTYTYTVTEKGDVDGVTNDTEATKTLTFTVTDDGTGNLTVTPTTDQVQLSFTNVYNADGEASIVVSKEITGAAWPTDKTLTLTIAGANGAPMPETKTATLSAAGSVTFGPIKYGLSDAGKTYEYTITEDSFGSGWSGSPASVKATVEVTDNGDGTLNAEVTYDPTDAKFTNTYTASGTATIEATKAIAGAAWPAGKTITFTLAGTESAPMPAEGGETVTLTEAGKATFGEITYTEADAGKTYTYTISEKGFGQGWTGSDDITAEVKVTDNGNGTLKTEVTYTPVDATITNTYEAEGKANIEVTKALAGAAWPAGKTVNFTIAGNADEDGNIPPMPTTTSVELKEAGKANFGEIAFTEADAGKTYTYTISEDKSFGSGWTKSADVTATVKVTDNGDGSLKTEITYTNDATITNTYNVEPTEAAFSVKKIVSVPEGLQGPADWSFDINVAPIGDAPSAESMTGKVTKTNDTVAFGPFTFNAPGEYKYTVTESGTVPGVNNDEQALTGKTVTIEVRDNGDGTMTAEVTSDNPLTFTNAYSVEPTTASFPVKKVLSIPEGLKGPAEWSYGITVSGTPAADTMQGTVNQNNNTVTFGPFTYTAPGTYTYTVKETGTVEDVNNDADAESGKTVTVTVADNGKGALTADVTSTPDSPLTFINSVYKSQGSATISGSKRLYYTVDETAAETSESEEEGNKVVLDNTDGTLVIVKENEAAEEEKDLKLKGGEFTFEIHYAKDPNKKQLATASNGASGDGGAATFTFPTFTYTNEDLKDLVSQGFASRTSEDGATVFTVEYAITELPSENKAMQANTQTFTVVAKFTDNGQGTMTPSYSGDINFEFKNHYVSNVAEVDLNGLKVMEGNRGLAGGEFTFTVSGDGPMPENTTATNDAGGAVNFGTIKFNKASLGDKDSATFTYTITEQDPEDPDVTPDLTPKTVTVTVTDDGEGHITATTNPATAPLFTFTNQYTPRPGNLSVTKVVTGEDADLTKSFNFTVTLEDASISGTYGGMTFNNGVAQFSLSNGQTMTATGLPADTPYTVTEADYSADFYDTTPSENASGTIPVAETAAVTFTNHFMDVIGGALVAPTGTKYFENGTLKDGEFSFQIKDESGSVVSTGTNDAAGNITFSHIAYGKESLAGEKSKTFHYTVSEVIPAGATAENDYTVDGVIYDTSVKNIAVEVKRVEGGQIEATLTSDSDAITFTNEGETIEGKTVSVLKTWEDEKGKSLSWPKNAVVVVELLADGTPTGKTATLTADSPSATFSDLDESVLVYSVRENSAKGVDGKFEVSISGSDTEGFTVTNTVIPPETTPQTEPPTGIRTGDNTPILPYLATLLGALLIAITAGMGFGLKRRNR